MKTNTITYSKVFSLGNYENEKIGVEIQVEEGDDIQTVIQNARQFVEFNHKLNGFHSEIDHLNHIVSNPDDYTGNQVKNAKERIEILENQISKGLKLLTV